MTACLVLAEVATLSCNSMAPAGFWRSFQKAFIVSQKSDQGPWGGWRWVEWRSDRPGTFRESNVRDFAERNGWKCSDRSEYSAQELATWHGRRRPIFPLLYPIDRGPTYYVDVERFPRTISVDSVVLKCDSGWTRSDPTGTAPSLVTAYGYIHISNDGRQMAVYHMWGE
jgi:hypothetical protein